MVFRFFRRIGKLDGPGKAKLFEVPNHTGIWQGPEFHGDRPYGSGENGIPELSF